MSVAPRAFRSSSSAVRIISSGSFVLRICDVISRHKAFTLRASAGFVEQSGIFCGERYPFRHSPDQVNLILGPPPEPGTWTLKLPIVSPRSLMGITRLGLGLPTSVPAGLSSAETSLEEADTAVAPRGV